VTVLVLLGGRREEMAMQPQIIQSMHDQVRAIYRALTGEDVGEGVSSEVAEETDDESITRRFAELEVMSRAFPSVTERVPPFTFTPPLDVIATDDAVLLEIELPGLDRDAITIERSPDALRISGVRRDGHAARGSLFHAEIPRGPFLRTIPLPFPVDADPRIELDRGVLRIHLTVAATTGREGKRPDSTEQERRDDQNGEQ
jgi:HSP20 family protein